MHARAIAEKSGMLKKSIVHLGGYTWCLFPWLGTRDVYKRQVYEGSAEITPGMWTKVYFDISQAAENFETVDNMTLWIKDKDGNKANAEYSLSVSGIDSYKKDMSKFTRFVLIIVCVVSTILSVVCIVAVIKVLIIRRKKRRRWAVSYTHLAR